MLYKALMTAFMLLAATREVVYVDLTSAHTAPANGEQTVSVRGLGGLLYHGKAPRPLPETPAISLKLNRIISVSEGDGFPSKAVEVFLTNTGKTTLSLPISVETQSLLKPSSEERRYLSFSVTLGKSIQVGSAESASNKDHPDSIAQLKPGDQATFLLPISTPRTNLEGEQITVSVSLYRKVTDKGTDWTEPVGEAIRSGNTLPLD